MINTDQNDAPNTGETWLTRFSTRNSKIKSLIKLCIAKSFVAGTLQHKSSVFTLQKDTHIDTFYEAGKERRGQSAAGRKLI